MGSIILGHVVLDELVVDCRTGSGDGSGLCARKRANQSRVDKDLVHLAARKGAANIYGFEGVADGQHKASNDRAQKAPPKFHNNNAGTNVANCWGETWVGSMARARWKYTIKKLRFEFPLEPKACQL